MWCGYRTTVSPTLSTGESSKPARCTMFSYGTLHMPPLRSVQSSWLKRTKRKKDTGKLANEGLTCRFFALLRFIVLQNVLNLAVQDETESIKCLCCDGQALLHPMQRVS